MTLFQSNLIEYFHPDGLKSHYFDKKYASWRLIYITPFPSIEKIVDQTSLISNKPPE